MSSPALRSSSLKYLPAPPTPLPRKYSTVAKYIRCPNVWIVKLWRRHRKNQYCRKGKITTPILFPLSSCPGVSTEIITTTFIN